MRTVPMLLLLVLMVVTGCSSYQDFYEDRPFILKEQLNHYPYFFYNETGFDALIVVEDNAPSQDLKSAQMLLESFKQRDDSIDDQLIVRYPSEYRTIGSRHAIYIGSCSQRPQNKFVNIYTDCLSIKPEQALVRIIDHHGSWLMFVVGATPDKTRDAINLLSDFETYREAKGMEGQDIEVISTEQGYKTGEPT